MLRGVLGVNAATSMAAGVVGIAAARWLTTELGIPGVGWTTSISTALIVFAIAVAAVALRSSGRLRTAAALVSAVDLAWVAGTILVVSAVDLTTAGRVVAVVLGVGVLDFAVLQLRFRSQLT